MGCKPLAQLIERSAHVDQIRRLLRDHRVVALVGAGAHDRASPPGTTQGGAELDLLVVRGTRRRGFEFKRADAPRLTASMRAALTDLRLDSLDVLYPGNTTYRLAERVRAVPLGRLLEDVHPLG